MDSLILDGLRQPAFRAGLCIVLAGVVLAMRRAIGHRPLAAHLRPPMALIAVGLIFGALDSAAYLWDLGPLVAYLDAVFFGAVAIGIARVSLILFVDIYLKHHGGAAVSAIFRDVASIVIYFLVIVAVLRSTLRINIASLIATSAVLTAIIGLALQDVLANIFSGLVLELEQPFSRGDWVRIGTFEGVVEETGWRTTKIRTRVNEIITLPNAMLSKEAVVNYSRPDPRYGDTLRFDVGYEIAPSVVQDTVTEVFYAEPAVLRDPPLEVRFERFAENGATYAIRYWITEFRDLERIRNRLHTNLWYGLRRAQIRVAVPSRELFVYRGNRVTNAQETYDVFATLRAIPLLAPLKDDVLNSLVSKARRITFGRGELIVREGEPGDSFYVIERGKAEVVVGEDPYARSVAQLSQGSFFGEMSLLAGEARTATVRAASDLTVLMIDRTSFREVIIADPALVMPLSEIVTRRQRELNEEREKLIALHQPHADEHAHRLGERIRAFFGLH